ncbi:Non-specific lipid transfer protein GPI-anchored 9 [Cardamine amara subsp. amara]|uniref:Non-specific lipid transfer protein GPI-anchored 9 n=1 Tax=Cardamine amara subsp. amara TaxID=228776 RepID=A0ABD1BE62_CARAN
MEISKFLAVVVAVIILYSVEATAQGGADLQSCIQKLIPCQSSLKMKNPHPPASCCGPLKEVVEKEAVCLCTVFNDIEILKHFNITKEYAMDLPKACGINTDVSQCAKYASAPSASPGSTNGTSSASIISFNRFSFLSAFVALLFF